MIHNVWTCFCGNAKEMLDQVQVLQKLDTQIIQIYAKRFNVDKAQVELLMNKETWFSASEALEIGAITKVIKSEEAKTIMASVFDLSIYKNVPKELLDQNLTARLENAKDPQEPKIEVPKTEDIKDTIVPIDNELMKKRLELMLKESEILETTLAM
jgi:ATP-dependent Clp protease, protease subunit